MPTKVCFCEAMMAPPGSDRTRMGKLWSHSGDAVLPFVCTACLASLLFGYHLGVINGALDHIAAGLGFADDAILQGWVVSSTLAGAAAGSLTGGALADRIGRRRTFQLNALPLFLGPLLSSNSGGFESMVLGRILAGIGIGIASSVVPLYISEIAPTEDRGSLGSLNQIGINIGILLALVAGLPLAHSPNWWRAMFLLSTLPAILLLLGMFKCPESPRWLVKQGRYAEAEAVSRLLWGKTNKFEEEIGNLKTDGSETFDEDAIWGELLSKRYWKVVSTGASLFLIQQLSGINTVVFFSTAVFRGAGIKSDVAASALVGLANVMGSMVASSQMDKQGRKYLLMSSFTGMGASMVLLALSLAWRSLQTFSAILAVLATVAYMLAFSYGAGPVPALLLAEMFASRIRAKAMAFSLGVHWVCNFVVGLLFLSVVEKVGVSVVYLAFGAVCFCGTFYVSKNLVETKGRSLEEIERELSPAVYNDAPGFAIL
ncbi:plastidic glucose transporter 4 isoform X4 [Physcomitrium patens]|uniref:Major facilitator superfamily (MFS) profile domain-containing protein n=1 Tax=Physcomitrium patens TaxID=3218 RepID=A0A2K1J1G3_PHYPA|nr:plastidic glucose transporter 4-like isoform X3 [Physcomitrium patens]PNR35356.1 hypothetical protein PHYPA_023256 [Physcomitrium patens]|eukprot:XP_024402624.1 plastidic glucose transporter 4-like isoform X3 [Physcomitrella patens]